MAILKIFKPSQMVTIMIALTVFIGVLIADLMTPLGYAHWLLYVFPLLIIYITGNPILIYFFLFITALSLIIGGIQSPIVPLYENLREVSLINRTAGLIVILLFSIIIVKLMQAHNRSKKLSNELYYTNKDLESFSYSAAHDLRAPLNMIKLFSEVLIEEYSDKIEPEGKEYLQKICNTSDNMATLISDMLSLSQITRHEISFTSIELSTLAASIIEELRTLEPNRIINVHIANSLKARADIHLIKIALKNLLGNALKYTSKKEIAEISFGVKEWKGEKIFYIKDNGVGFDMSISEKLFVPFKRLHSSSQFTGTGIGLSIVERIISKHGGRIWGEGETGKGATFYFTLPK